MRDGTLKYTPAPAGPRVQPYTQSYTQATGRVERTLTFASSCSWGLRLFRPPSPRSTRIPPRRSPLDQLLDRAPDVDLYAVLCANGTGTGSLRPHVTTGCLL